MRDAIRITLSPGVDMPERASSGASGYDLKARLEEAVVLQPLEHKLIPTGIRMEIPYGYEAQVRPRSGLALRQGITVLNAPGTIDSDYRGEIGVILINLSNEPRAIQPNDRVAQLVFQEVAYPAALDQAALPLSRTARGEAGYGSTGK